MLFLNKKIPIQVQEFHQDLLIYAEQLLQNQIIFSHEWDMEQCLHPYIFQEDWEMKPNNDPEWTWMLNRCRFVEQLGLAYYISGDKRFAQKAQYFIENWIEYDNSHNQTNITTIWRRIDTGIRIVHWIKALEYIQDTCPQSFIDSVKDSLYKQGCFLANNFTNTSYTSNWGVMEFYGLLCLSLFANFPESSKWKELSIQIIEVTARCQILADGVQWERSPMYHNEVLSCYLDTLFLSHTQNISLSFDFKTIVTKMVYANLLWQKPDGCQPILGDSDNTNLQSLMSRAAAILKNGEFKQLPLLDNDYYYYLTDIYDSVQLVKPKITSHYFDQAGIFILRHGTSQINFITKNFGGGHSHSDLLHLDFFSNNQDYLIDCGRYSYTECSERAYLKSSKAHNSIIINDKERNTYKDSWSNFTEANYVAGNWKSQQGLEWCYSHDLSYIDDGVFLTRDIIHLGRSGFLVMDTIQCNKHTKYELIFNTPRTVYITSNYTQLDDLYLFSTIQCTQNIGMRSSHYNQKSPCVQIIQNGETSHNTIIANLFTFQKNSSLVEFTPQDRKLRDVPINKARGFHCQIGTETYTILQKIAPSATNSGFFLVWDNNFYINHHVLLKNNELIFNF